MVRALTALAQPVLEAPPDIDRLGNCRSQRAAGVVEPERFEQPIARVVAGDRGRNGLAAASLWVGLPPYLGDAINPQGALALLLELDKLFAFAPDLAKAEEASRDFVKQVDDALVENDEMRMYLSELEQRIDSGVIGAGTPDLPPAGDLMGDLEAFLRKHRQD